MPERETELTMRQAREYLAMLLNIPPEQIDAWVLVALDTVNKQAHFYSSPTVKPSQVPAFLIWGATELQNKKAEAN